MSLSQAIIDALKRSPRFMQGVANNNAGGGLTTNDPMADYERFASNELGSLASSAVTDLRSNIVGIANREGQEKAVTDARLDASQGADVAEGIYNRATETFGQTERQRMGTKARFSLGREVAKAAASGSTRRGFAQRGRAADQALSGLDDASFGQQLAMLAGLSSAKGQELVNQANTRASNRAARNNLIGTGAGILGMLVMASSENYKDKVEEKPKLLDKLKQVRIDKWAYKGSDINHIGPYAEEFNEAFNVGKYSDAIDTVSLLGITLGAVKELNAKVEAMK